MEDKVLYWLALSTGSSVWASEILPADAWDFGRQKSVTKAGKKAIFIPAERGDRAGDGESRSRLQLASVVL
mgnify:CR=1 FL=1